MFTHVPAHNMQKKKQFQITVRNMADVAIPISGKLLQSEDTRKIKSVTPEVKKLLQQGILQVVTDGCD